MNDKEITVKMRKGSSCENPKKENILKFPIYEEENPNIYRHPRKIKGYCWEDKDGAIIIERSDGKRSRLVLP